MKTKISESPEIDAGKYLGELLHTHKNKAKLLLVSGGSSLRLLEHIPTEAISVRLSVGLVDDRFTETQEGNNFLALMQTNFYATCTKQGVSFISSVPEKNENLESYCERIKTSLESFYVQHPDCYTIGVFGIGEDGHTASIFPSNESEFQMTYLQDAFCTAVERPNLQYPHRVTVTPTFIEDKVDDVLLYAVGSTKCDNILNYMHNKNFSHHEIPALIPAQHPRSILFTDCQTLL